MALCAEMLHRIFPDLDVRDIQPAETQKAEKLDLHIRGVRFDIFTTIAKNFFDVEMQKERLDDVFKRPRAYQTVITYRGLEQATLKKSGNYKDLPDAYVVFICNFDPFKKGRCILRWLVATGALLSGHFALSVAGLRYYFMFNHNIIMSRYPLKQRVR